MLYCRTCKARFSERKGTPLFGSQLSADQALSIFEHLADRTGVRATARLVKKQIIRFQWASTPTWR
jgi:LacI family transcriptional regulator